MNPYDYSRTEPDFNLQLKGTRPSFFHYQAAFASAYPTQYRESNTGWGEYFMPRNRERFPLAILLHALGEKSLIPCRMLAVHLAKMGIASFLPYLTYHSKRVPKVMKGRFTAVTATEWLKATQLSVINVRQIIDWGMEREEIDDERIAIVGMSLGGIISAVAMGVDKRIEAGAFLVTGGNSEKITWNSRSPMARKIRSDPRCCTWEECHYVYSQYPGYLADVAKRGFENVTPAKECFLYDPMTFAYYLRGRPILMINALYDRAIPKCCTLEFWEACGRPDIIWLPATHITSFLYWPFISRKVAVFLQSAFGLKGAPA